MIRALPLVTHAQALAGWRSDTVETCPQELCIQLWPIFWDVDTNRGRNWQLDRSFGDALAMLTLCVQSEQQQGSDRVSEE